MLLTIDDDDPAPTGEQLKQQLQAMIVGRVLERGARLPSVRQLAADLRVAPGTVARAYKELEASGHLATTRTGTTVAALGDRADAELRQHLDNAARAYATKAARAGIQLTEALEAVRRAYREHPNTTTSSA